MSGPIEDLAMQIGPRPWAGGGQVTIWELPNGKRVTLITPNAGEDGWQKVASANGSRAFLPLDADPTDIINIFLRAMHP